MVRELLAVKTPEEKIAWEARWSAHLSGEIAKYKHEQAQPERPKRAPLPDHRSPVR